MWLLMSRLWVKEELMKRRSSLLFRSANLWWISNEHEIEVVVEVLVVEMGFCWLGKKEIQHGFIFSKCLWY